jgi:ribosome-associated protein
MTPVSLTFLTPIRLDQFLKLSGVAGSGGEAKVLIQSGEVKVNGDVEVRRGRMLNAGDIVSIHEQTLPVVDSRGDAP